MVTFNLWRYDIMLTLWFIGAFVFGLFFNIGGLMVYFTVSAILSMAYIIADEVKFEALLK